MISLTHNKIRHKIEFDFSSDYILKFLPLIEDVDDDKSDVLNNKNSKFLFYNFNSYLNSIGEDSHLARHTNISDDSYALNALQNKNWPYFIDRLIEYSQRGFNDFSGLKADIIYNNINNF